MEKGWIDSHAHLADEAFIETVDEVIARAKDHNVVKVCVIACSHDDFKRATALHRQYGDFIDIAYGFHPSDAGKIETVDLQRLEDGLGKPGVVALGEIGLDYYWVKDNKDQQRDLFVKQIAIANQRRLPISVHTRDAMQDTFDILKKYPVEKRGVIHCYGGEVEMAREFIKLGYVLSFGGPLTFKNARAPKEVVADTLLANLLTETDSPYLTPHPFRGKVNEPMYIHLVGEMMAELKGIDVAAVQTAVAENYQRVFGGVE